MDVPKCSWYHLWKAPVGHLDQVLLLVHAILCSLCVCSKQNLQNLTSPELLILCERARLIFSEFSLEIKASLALCMASKLLLTVLCMGWRVRVGTFSFKTDGSFGFLPMASWYGENPCTLWSEFLALIHQDTAKLGWH